MGRGVELKGAKVETVSIGKVGTQDLENVETSYKGFDLFFD